MGQQQQQRMGTALFADFEGFLRGWGAGAGREGDAAVDLLGLERCCFLLEWPAVGVREVVLSERQKGIILGEIRGLLLRD